MLNREVHGAIAVLRLEHGKASALDLEFLERLVAALDDEARAGERALVLTGAASIFSAGVDLPRLLKGGADYVASFLPALDAFFLGLIRFQKPLVAAVNGHAIAGGCVITCACDARLMARGKATIGVPELRVGVPFPQSAFEIMRHALSPAHFREVVLLGRNYDPESALARGLVDEIAEPSELASQAIARAEELASHPPRAFALNKQMLWQPVLDRFARHGRDWERATLAAWTSDEVLGAVREYVARTLKK